MHTTASEDGWCDFIQVQSQPQILFRGKTGVEETGEVTYCKPIRTSGQE